MGERGLRNVVNVRTLLPTDRVDAITDLLHRAYARNAAAGLRFVATHQESAVTAERLAQGYSFIAEIDEEIVGTITVRAPEKTPYGEYDPPFPIAAFGQFAVDPDRKGLGIGDALLTNAEGVALEAGCQELTLDTAQPAAELIAYYERRGFRIVGRADWRPETNYESWIMGKRLSTPGS